MQVKGCMLLGFRSKRFEGIQQYYSRAELFVYNEAGTVVFDSTQGHDISEIIAAKDRGDRKSVV